MTHAREVEAGQRFQFGENWRRFLGVLDESRIAAAEDSLRKAFAGEDLAGRTFLDAGSGSGLFSLAARRLGARVQSFDFDPQSVACTLELEQGFIHPSLNCEDLHPAIAHYEASIARELVELPRLATIIKASFGFGDVNACVVLRKWRGPRQDQRSE